MKALNHAQAQRLIHARLDGALKSADSARLSAHLQTCQTCRQYADQIGRLDAGLRLEFRSHALSAPAVSAHAFEAIPHQVIQSRAKMNTNRILASSLSFVLLLIFLAGGLSLLLSNRNLLSVLAPPAPVRQPPPGILPTPLPTPTALPTPTPTPLPAWTIDSPLTSTPAILALLNELSAKNRDFIHAPGWLHSTRRDAGQEGTIPTSYIETWLKFSIPEGVFPESLVIVKDQPDGERLIQLQVCLSDGLCGDLVALRKGEGTLEQLDAPPDPTTVGLLAQRLAGQGELSKSGKVDQALAWFENLDGKPVFFLSLHYSPLQLSPSTPETTEVYSIDLETGLLLRENLRQVYMDGTLFGETLSAYQYEFLPELPADVAGQFSEASAELLSFSGSTASAHVTSTPLPGSAPVTLENLAYTRDAPLTDGPKILEQLLALRQRLSEGIARSGWYVFDPLLPQGQDWTSSRSTVLQVNDDGTCQSMAYYLKDGQILPNEITLVDGAWGLVGDVQTGIFTEAEANHAPCSPEQVDNLAWIANEIDFFRDFSAGEIDGEYRLWVETVAGRQVLVLFYDIRYQPPKPVIMDPDMRALEPEDRSLKWLYFDLETGSILGQYEQVTLQNGKTFGETFKEGNPLPLGIHYYDNLPAEVLQAFEQAAQDLRSHLEGMTR